MALKFEKKEKRGIDLSIIRKIVGDSVDTSEADKILEDERLNFEARKNAFTIEVQEVKADDILYPFE